MDSEGDVMSAEISVDANNLRNVFPTADGSATYYEARMNAVVVQVFPEGGRAVSIECKDPEMLPQLREQAQAVIGGLRYIEAALDHEAYDARDDAADHELIDP